MNQHKILISILVLILVILIILTVVYAEQVWHNYAQTNNSLLISESNDANTPLTVEERILSLDSMIVNDDAAGTITKIEDLTPEERAKQLDVLDVITEDDVTNNTTTSVETSSVVEANQSTGNFETDASIEQRIDALESIMMDGEEL